MSERPEPTTAEIDKAAEWCASDSDGCGDCPHGDDLCAEMFARAYLAARKEIEALRKVEEAALPFALAHKRAYPDYFTEDQRMRNIHDSNLVIPRWKSIREELSCGDFAAIRKALADLAEERRG